MKSWLRSAGEAKRKKKMHQKKFLFRASGEPQRVKMPQRTFSSFLYWTFESFEFDKSLHSTSLINAPLCVGSIYEDDEKAHYYLKYPLFLHFPLWNPIRGLAWTGSSSFYSNIEADNVLCRRHPVTIHWISENGKYSTFKKKGKEQLKAFSVEDFYCRYISDFMKNPKTSKDKETLFWWFAFHCFW